MMSGYKLKVSDERAREREETVLMASDTNLSKYRINTHITLRFMQVFTYHALPPHIIRAGGQAHYTKICLYVAATLISIID